MKEPKYDSFQVKFYHCNNLLRTFILILFNTDLTIDSIKIRFMTKWLGDQEKTWVHMCIPSVFGVFAGL